MKLLIDAHVHIYPSYNLEYLFDNAYKNFSHYDNNVDAYGIILTERYDCDAYSELARRKTIKDYQINLKDDFLILSKQNSKNMYIFPGQQINTKEGLEILAYFVKNKIPQKLSFKELFQKIYDYKSFPIINWAPGKWLGKRGQLIRSILSNKERVLLGISSLLPEKFKLPKIAVDYKYPILLGSDPFPLKWQESLIGTCGISINVNNLDSIEELRSNIANGNFQLFGKRDSIFRVITRLIRSEFKRRFTK